MEAQVDVAEPFELGRVEPVEPDRVAVVGADDLLDRQQVVLPAQAVVDHRRRRGLEGVQVAELDRDRVGDR